jgi:sulfofructose kinase
MLYQKARALGIPTVIDAEKADAVAYTTLLPLVDHVIFSDPGLRSFTGGAALNDDVSRIKALKKVRALGCRVAAVTVGVQGTLWLDDAGIHRQTAFTVKVVDTTGAGDVFHGAYTLAIGEGQTITQAMRFASAVAALKCTRRGGRAEVDVFLAEQAALAQG